MNAKYYIKITSVLLIICAVIAGLLATVNSLTKGKIEEYNLNKCKDSIILIFPNMSDFKDIGYEGENKSVNTIYEIYSDNETLIGHCVDAKSSGYGGIVNVIVGVDTDGNIAGIGLLKHSETKGITDQTLANGLFDRITRSNSTEVDNIAGATYSSVAVKNCVKAALSALDISEEK